MVDVLVSHAGKVEKGNLGESSDGFVWIHSYGDEKELEEIYKKTKIPVTRVEKEYIRPRLRDYGEYSWIMLKVPKEDRKLSQINLFVTKKMIITVTFDKIAAIERIKKIDGQKAFFDKGLTHFTYRLIDLSIEDYKKVYDGLEKDIDEIEKRIMKTGTDKVTSKIYSLKKIFTHLRKGLTANREVISSLEKGYAGQLDKDEVREFRETNSDLEQLIDLQGTLTEMLKTSLDIYYAALNHSTNRIMKTLTAISAFVLVPTLITGIYGMNFAKNSVYNMPELYWKYGYFFSLVLMLVSTIVTYLLFKRKRWL